MMKRIAVTTALLMALAIPAVAAENPCVTVDILDGQISRQASLVEYQDGAPRYSVNGPFIWFTWDESAGETNTLSFNVAEVDRAVGCADGSVTLTATPVAPVEVPVETPAPAEAPVSLRPVCEVFVETLEYVCSLPNLTLRIS